MERHDEEDEEDSPPPKVPGKRKGNDSASPPQSPIPSRQHFYASFHPYKFGGVKSKYSLSNRSSFISSLREVSVSTAMSNMRLDDEGITPSEDDRVIAYEHNAVTLRHKSSNITMRRTRLVPSNVALLVEESPAAGGSLQALKTPSHIPVLQRAEPQETHVTATPSKTRHSLSPTKTPYLTKDSNITALTAWDTRGRLEDVESMYEDLKRTMDGESLERNGLKETVSIYKVRSKLSSLARRIFPELCLLAT